MTAQAAAAVEWQAPIKTKATGNLRLTNSRWAAMAQRREEAAIRDGARALTINALRRANLQPEALMPCLITVTRISAGRLDAHDGLPAACKRAVDGVALALGIDDASPRIEWRYAQEKCAPRRYGLRVRIERRAP